MTDTNTGAKWAAHVRRNAAGLTRQQVAHQLRNVRAWERNTTPDNYSGIGAQHSAAEWQRIYTLMIESGATEYQPDADPIVHAALIAERDRYRTAWRSACERATTQREFRAEDAEDDARIVQGLRARLARVVAVFGQIDTGIECGVCEHKTTARYRGDGHAMCADCMGEVEW